MPLDVLHRLTVNRDSFASFNLNASYFTCLAYVTGYHPNIHLF